MLFVLPEVFTLVLGPSFDLPCLLATAILDSFSLFYLPNKTIRMKKLLALTLPGHKSSGTGKSRLAFMPFGVFVFVFVLLFGALLPLGF